MSVNLQELLPSGFYVLVAAAAIFLVESVYLALSSTWRRKRSINRRMMAIDSGLRGEEVLVHLRRQRGVSDSNLTGVMGWLRRMMLQSGLRLSMGKFAAVTIVIWLLLTLLLAVYFRVDLIWSAPAGIAISAGSILMFIRIARSRRQKRFIAQLPDAVDIVVRSLKAGHPVPVALAMVGRELSDPVGTEFGMTVDEMTYGLEMEQAMRNMYERVGHPDLSLLVTAVSLQAATGGNLAEILSSLSKVIRERFQLQRKVRALSAEGRVSAYGLSLLPLIVFGAVSFLAPSYYDEVWNDPIFVPVLGIVIAWAMVGNFMMYKMINFKF